MLEAAVDGIVVIDERGRIEAFNSAAEKLFDRTADEVLGLDVGILMPEPHASEHAGYLADYLDTGRRHVIGTGRVVEAQRRNGSTFPIELSVGEGRSDGRRFFVGIVRDISERTNLEEAVRDQRERLARMTRINTLGEMAAGIAHEVNQPLTAIASYAHACRNLIERGQADSPEVLAALNKLANQAERAGEVIRRLRDLVKKRQASRELVDLNRLVVNVVELGDGDARRKGLTIHTDLATPAPRVVGDPVQIEQVVLNLLHNAMESMVERDAPGATIEVVTSMLDRQMVEVSVLDHGVGVSDEVEGALFDPFFTTKESGMGMGLAISRSIVASHGGQMWFTANEDGGTTFHFSLPKAVEPEPRED